MKKRFLVIFLVVLLIFSVSYVDAQEQQALTFKDLFNSFKEIFITGKATICSLLITTGSTLPSGIIGASYSTSINALSDCFGSFTWTWVSIIGPPFPPPGLNLTGAHKITH